MKKTACQYTIVRFAPFIETGEFANVGILMMAPNARYFDYMLLTRRHGRITKFFEELDAKVFKSAMYALKDELSRVHSVLKAHGFDRRYKINDVEFAQGMFAEIVRPRESILRFSEPRAVLAEDPKKTLEELFAFYVERNFTTTREYRETVLDRGIRNLLFQAQVGERFTREKVGNDEYFVTFPFVEMHAKKPTKIIKPLHLDQENSSKILEHGGKWEFRVRELHKHHDLSPEKILFVVDGPTSSNDSRAKACQEAIDMLHETGSNVQPYTLKEKILDFASKHLVH